MIIRRPMPYPDHPMDAKMIEISSPSSPPSSSPSSPSSPLPPPPSSSTNCPHQHQDSTGMSRDCHAPFALAAFLQSDIDPQGGRRLLLPFLTTMDRLRLSKCSQGLRDYRYHLSKIEIVDIHPTPRPSPWEGIEGLLRGQRGLLQYLRLGHYWSLDLLELASEGCFKGLKTLDLSGLESDGDYLYDDEVEYVTEALAGGGLGGLEELDLGSFPGREEDMEAILALLTAGMCPQLRRLNLHWRMGFGDVCLGPAVVEALESGHLHHLEQLDLSGVDLGADGGGAAIARALQGGVCPRLAKLEMACCNLSQEDGQALSEAMRSGSCAKLVELDLACNNDMGNEGATAILGAIEAGSCPSLKLLGLRRDWHTSASVETVTALVRSLRSGHCHHIERLDLLPAIVNRDSSLDVLQAIQQGALPNLLRFDMASPFMDQEHGRVLGKAIGEGAVPQLEELRISRMRLFDDGVVPIMAGLEGGGCPHLKELCCGGVKMGPQGGHALARALASGNLSCLRRLVVDRNGLIGDEAMAEVVKGLSECRQLQRLSIGYTGMGFMAGQALVQALQDKAWPKLEKLDPSSNMHLMSDEGLVEGLAEVLERRGEFCPLLTRVDLRYAGVKEEWEASGRLARLPGKLLLLVDDYEEEEEEEEE